MKLAVGDTVEVEWRVPQFTVLTHDACRQLVGQVCKLSDFTVGRSHLPAGAQCKVLRALMADDGLSVQLLLQRVR